MNFASNLPDPRFKTGTDTYKREKILKKVN